MTAKLQIVCEVFGVDLTRKQIERIEKALTEAAKDVFDLPIRGLWVHEGVRGPTSPHYIECPFCGSPPGVGCRDTSVTHRFVPRARGFHDERSEKSGFR
ncbi:MAG: hypothetical protein DRH30_09290 [Deltaproteobacteria bacterium]|nr:MAG: hypothetical protein DRH30_09290 [Deltaproteobacteria bacterium]